MPCIVVLKEKIVPFGKTLFYRGEGTVGVIQKNLMSLGGQEENVSSKENSPAPRDFINERSFNTSFEGIFCQQKTANLVGVN